MVLRLLLHSCYCSLYSDEICSTNVYIEALRVLVRRNSTLCESGIKQANAAEFICVDLAGFALHVVDGIHLLLLFRFYRFINFNPNSYSLLMCVWRSPSPRRLRPQWICFVFLFLFVEYTIDLQFVRFRIVHLQMSKSTNQRIYDLWISYNCFHL